MEYKSSSPYLSGVSVLLYEKDAKNRTVTWEHS